MDKTDLAEIRALLQASAPAERPRRPLLGALRALIPGPSERLPEKAGSAGPPPRRVGLRPAAPIDAEADALLLDHPVAGPEEADAACRPHRRDAFGQRRDTAPLHAAPVLQLRRPLALPAPPVAELADPPRRRSPGVARLAPAPAETPYHPEDLFDAAGHDAEKIYAASGLFDPRPPIDPPLIDVDPERELLRHLERVFLAERAALQVAPAASAAERRTASASA